MTGKPPPDEVLGIEDLHVTVHDGAATAVRGVSLSVAAGEIVGLVGESGSGKTLTCRAALGVLPRGCAVGRGTISFERQDVTGLSRRGWERLHGTGIGAVFQDPASYLNPNLTVGSQLAEVLRVKQRLRRREAHRQEHRLAGGRRPAPSGLGLPPDPGRTVRRHAAAGHDRDRDLLRAAAAHRRRGHHGARRHDPGGDHRAAASELRDQRGLAVLFVSHDLAVIRELCDRVVVFYAGEVVESGPVEEIIERPRHPYTQALLQVASVGDFRRRELRVIPGQPPPVGADITGCRFAGRCPAAIEACRSGPVSLVPLCPGHQARCVRASDPELTAATATTAATTAAAEAAELAAR